MYYKSQIGNIDSPRIGLISMVLKLLEEAMSFLQGWRTELALCASGTTLPSPSGETFGMAVCLFAYDLFPELG